ncbi:MAG TPA: hypothetical protein VG164_15175, partial [Trebonia sp.]|nr:hypothetical protein [Trebonia sp.]
MAAAGSALARSEEKSGVRPPFDIDARHRSAEKAIRAAAAAATAAGRDPAVEGLDEPGALDETGGWRWQVLGELRGLSTDVAADYARARRKQSRQAWESRVGPYVTGGSAAAGSVISAVGAGVLHVSTVPGIIVIIAGVVFAAVGAVFTASTYVRSRKEKLRY